MNGPIRRHVYEGWHVAVQRGASGGYVAWACATPASSPMDAPAMELHYSFGETEAEALYALKAGLPTLHA